MRIITRAISIGLAMAFLHGCESSQRRRGVEDMAPAARSFVGRAAPDAESEARTLPVLDEKATLADYLTYAALNNPGLEAAFNRWKAKLERIPQVRALPDPRFTYGYFIREVETRVGPQRQRVGLSQVFPWFGKLSLRGDVAAEAAEAEHQRYEAAKLQLFYEVRYAYCEYYYLSRAVEVVGENKALVAYLESVARTKYKTSAAQHADVIRAQVELGKLEDQLRSLQEFRQPIVARLNAALNRASDAALPWPKSLPDDQVELSDARLVEWLEQASPELKALDYEIAKERQSIELAKKAYFPDLTVGVDYTEVGDAVRPDAPGWRSPAAQRSAARLAQGMGDALDVSTIGQSFIPGDRPGDSGQDAWMLWFSVNLPIWVDKYSAGEREARAKYRAAVQAKAERENTLVAKVKMSLYYFRDAERKIDLYRDTLVPKASESLKTTEVGFRAGTSTFLDLIDAERALLEFQLSYERAQVNRAQRLAELEMLVGKEVPRMGPSSQPAAREAVGPAAP
ncbi:MAG: TolC family protein [Phycisphaerae bacterium]|nr:TolC family protein [Phycisphaerae bacterium]